MQLQATPRDAAKEVLLLVLLGLLVPLHATVINVAIQEMTAVLTFVP